MLGPRGVGRLAAAVARRVQRVVVQGMGPHLKKLVDENAVPLNITLPRQLDQYGGGWSGGRVGGPRSHSSHDRVLSRSSREAFKLKCLSRVYHVFITCV